VVATLNVVLEEQQFGRNQSLQFTATVEVAPDFVLPNYKGHAWRPSASLRVATDADGLDRALGILREQQSQV
jgi:FKBP-type peptidyl-prolyl cis-trans isomerase (trigger factor)